ncbi:hypothetical protein JZ751_003045 [Albula glossodonta]|uniref:Uncharacterized protein n=2 Tax=Albula TaxID=54908 RepID=A0A8T2NJU7_9TELE|nr:hypothetical protein JZ751_003045 [Albula glossodonta]
MERNISSSQKECLPPLPTHPAFPQSKASSPLRIRMASCGSCFWSIVWLIVLLVLAWPLSIFLGGLYGFIAPLTTCVGLDRLTDLLLEGANLGRTSALNMRHGKPLC